MIIRKLSEIKGEQGIEVAARLLSLTAELLTDPRNAELKGEKNPVKMLCAFAEHSPDIMRRIFAVLGGDDAEAYTGSASESMLNIAQLATDQIFLSFFISQGRTGDATSSASVSANTKE